MLDRLQAMGWLTHVRNDGPHEEGPQWAALKAADRHPLVRLADWVLFADVDEFVNIHAGDRTVAALLAALPRATAIPLTWRLFGNAGVVGILAMLRPASSHVTSCLNNCSPARCSDQCFVMVHKSAR